MIAPHDIRRLALALPEAREQDHHGQPSFRVRGRIFCTLRPDGSRLMVKLGVEDQHNFVLGHPGVVDAVPGYWGGKGSTFVDLATAEDQLVETLLHLAWSNVAPRSLGRDP
jgi:hypothetical protein